MQSFVSGGEDFVLNCVPGKFFHLSPVFHSEELGHLISIFVPEEWKKGSDDLLSFHCEVWVVHDYDLALMGPVPVNLVKQSASGLGTVPYIHDHVPEGHGVVV